MRPWQRDPEWYGDGWTPLHAAACASHAGVATMLIAQAAGGEATAPLGSPAAAAAAASSAAAAAAAAAAAPWINRAPPPLPPGAPPPWAFKQPHPPPYPPPQPQQQHQPHLQHQHHPPQQYQQHQQWQHRAPAQPPPPILYAHNRYGATPLHLAALLGSAPLTRVLLAGPSSLVPCSAQP